MEGGRGGPEKSFRWNYRRCQAWNEGSPMALVSRVVKRDACCFVGVVVGQAAGACGDACGLYCGDTRVLSRYVVGVTPGTLSATTVSFRAGDSGRVLLLADRLDSLTDPPRQVVVERRPVMADGMYERVTVTNYGDAPCRLELWFELGADFRDMFEVRGMKRPARGRLHPPEVEADRIRFRYRGLDGLDYVTEVRFTPPPLRCGRWSRVRRRPRRRPGPPCAPVP